MDMVEPLIKTTGMCFSYEDGSDGMLIKNADFVLRPGDRLMFDGANGSGKTTFLHLLIGLLKPARGRIEAFGAPREKESDFLEVRRRAGLVFQDPEDQLFCATVLEDVAFGPRNLGHSSRESADIARSTLDMLGLGGYEDRITYRLSGGEKRLVSLATVLAMEPEVLLLDEPTAGLDEDVRERIASILEAQPLSFVLVSHEKEFAERLCSGSVCLSNGRIK